MLKGKERNRTDNISTGWCGWLWEVIGLVFPSVVIYALEAVWPQSWDGFYQRGHERKELSLLDPKLHLNIPTNLTSHTLGCEAQYKDYIELLLQKIKASKKPQLHITMEPSMSTCIKCVFMCTCRSTHLCLNVLKYIYTQAPYPK